MLCIGHRGARGHEPENTLRSIRRALELGAQAIEIDVWNVQGELIVLHDARLERTTNGRGYASRKTVAQLQELDAGKGERIPLLREVIELIARRVPLNIELKGPRTAAPAVALIEEHTTRGWAYDDFVLSSFRRTELRRVQQLQPRLRLGLLLNRPTPFYHLAAQRLRAWSVHPALPHTTRRFVDDAHRRGYKVFVYTVNEPADIERLRSFGVDGVFTDFPDRVTG